MSEHPFQPSAHVPISCAVCGQEQRFHVATDDILGTVKALLREHSDREGDKCPCGVCDAVLSEDQQLVADWLLALVARVEQAEAQVAMLCSDEPCPKCGYGVAPICYGCLAKAAECDLADMQRQRDQWKEFAFKHPEITPPVVTQELAALRQRHAKAVLFGFHWNRGGIGYGGMDEADVVAAWLASEAKKGLI